MNLAQDRRGWLTFGLLTSRAYTAILAAPGNTGAERVEWGSGV